MRTNDSTSALFTRAAVAVDEPLGRVEARELTDRIRGRAEELWHMLLEAYERGAHTALGYGSWGEYFREEFGGKKSRAYQLIDASRVVRAIESHSTIVERPNEGQARELAPLAKEDPEQAAELWSEVVAEHGDKLNATDVRQAVKERAEFKDRLAALPEQTRMVLEQADENYDKHRNLLRNSNQMDHLANIAAKHGDETAAEVAELALTEEGGNTFKAYEKVKGDKMGVHYTSETGEWYTPERVVRKVQLVLGEIDLDPCAEPAKGIPAKAHVTKQEDGLSYEWDGKVYMNPPYGKEIRPWVEKLKCHHEAGDVPAAIALLPARTDTAWFAMLDAYPRCFVRGRLKFSGGANSAPFPSAAVYLGPDKGAFIEAFRDLGTVFERSAA